MNKNFQEENNTDVPKESAFCSHQHGNENNAPQRNTMTYLFDLVIIMLCFVTAQIDKETENGTLQSVQSTCFISTFHF